MSSYLVSTCIFVIPTDSAWPVYILPEEVGSRCSIIGSHVLVLHGRVEGSRVGKLEIYNPTDSNEPAISWDHDKIRRTGKLGRLLFIEIGRRCSGGPGLVWMYTGTSDRLAFELRDTLRRYIRCYIVNNTLLLQCSLPRTSTIIALPFL